MLSVGLANSEVVCADRELIRFNPRSGQDCVTYMQPYTSVMGGYLVNETARENCEYCSIKDTNVFLKSISSDYSQAWRNFGKFLALYTLTVFPLPPSPSF
jgi:ABC-type multidrug transport system permease subunit